MLRIQPRPMLRAALALAGICALDPATTYAGGVAFAKAEGVMWFGQTAMHGPAAPAHMHANAALPAAFWSSPFNIVTVAGPPDGVSVGMRIRHLVAPHAGEPAPGPLWAPVLVTGALPAGGVVAVGAGASLMHGPIHADMFAASLVSFSVAPGVIPWSLYAAAGRHDPENCTALTTVCTGQQSVPATPSTAVGTAALVIDGGTKQLAAAVVVQGIRSTELLGGSIRLGRPGEVGPVIIDLGSGAQWQEIGEGGLARILDVSFPEQFIPALAGGDTYLTLETMRYPRGEIRGQIGRAPPPQYQIGDLNCDGVVDFEDINPFVLALSDPQGYMRAFPQCTLMAGDINGDGRVDFEDINPFVALLAGA
ncbi:MAG: CHRD domain-containing protein [Planctomycetota bacterium]